MKITKTPKKVIVTFQEREIIQIRSVYTCPTCYTTIVGHVDGFATRFICSCGQELIVEKRTQRLNG